MTDIIQCTLGDLSGGGVSHGHRAHPEANDTHTRAGAGQGPGPGQGPWPWPGQGHGPGVHVGPTNGSPSTLSRMPCAPCGLRLSILRSRSRSTGPLTLLAVVLGLGLDGGGRILPPFPLLLLLALHPPQVVAIATWF